VIEEGSAIAGIIVLLPGPDYLLLDNIAVSPARQGSGLGRRLLAFAERRRWAAAIVRSASIRIRR
jgi:GNAT superfamily N-acetyltransferase